MIGKKSGIAIFLYMIFLVVLFLMCSTDLIIREPEKEVSQIAVIIEETRDDNYGNFRKGIDQAAVELNADVRFITLYDRLDREQQMELIGREQQDGADALIVVPVDEMQVGDALAGKRVSIPMVLLGTGKSSDDAAGVISIDYRQMGRKLAEGMIKRMPEGCPVVLLSEPGGLNAVSKDFLDGAEEVLRVSDHDCRRVVPDEEGGYERVLEMSAKEEAAYLAGSPEILSSAAGVLAENPSLEDRMKGLYGRGNTLEILGALDEGTITGICVTDEFSRGYFGVYMAVQALERAGSPKALALDSYYIEKEDLRDPEYEKMLYPME